MRAERAPSERRIASFATPGSIVCFPVAGNFTCLEVILSFRRRLGYYLFHTYIPTCLIVVMSWISFWIRPEAVPARVTLGVTSLLTLHTQHANSQKALPPVSYLKVGPLFSPDASETLDARVSPRRATGACCYRRRTCTTADGVVGATDTHGICHVPAASSRKSGRKHLVRGPGSMRCL